MFGYVFNLASFHSSINGNWYLTETLVNNFSSFNRGCFYPRLLKGWWKSKANMPPWKLTYFQLSERIWIHFLKKIKWWKVLYKPPCVINSVANLWSIYIKKKFKIIGKQILSNLLCNINLTNQEMERKEDNCKWDELSGKM